MISLPSYSKFEEFQGTLSKPLFFWQGIGIYSPTSRGSEGGCHIGTSAELSKFSVCAFFDFSQQKG